MDKIKISICMPTRNRAGFIGEALESVISQADDSVEIVIVDGASTDNTQDVVRKYQQRFKNLVYCRQEENGGVDRDMAKAIELSRGEYCWLLSDDDALKPGAIKRILKEIILGYEIYLCNVTVCGLSLRPVRKRFWLSRKVEDRVFNLHEKNELIEYCNKANSIGALFSYWSSIILRRQAWIDSGYDYDFDKTAYALAATLFSFINRKCRLKYIKDSLVFWRNDNESFQNEGGLVKRFLLDFDGYLQLADKYLPVDVALRVSFLKVMRREHPWYTIIHVVSFIDNPELWMQFRAKLFKFGYSERLVEICRALGKFKNIVTFAVKMKRKIVKGHRLNKIADLLHAEASRGRSNVLQRTPLFNYLLIFNVFGGSFTLFRYPFEFNLGYLFIIFFLVIYIRRYRRDHNQYFIKALIVLTIASFINVHLGNDTLFLMMKQVMGILITGIAYYLLVKVNNYEVEKLFKIYLRIALIVAAIGIFQEISFLIGFKIGYDYYGWVPLLNKWGFGGLGPLKLLRLNSIFLEPSHFAITMAPAFFVSMSDIFKINSFTLKAKWKSIVIIISYILTFSGIAYIVILISPLLFSVSKKLRYLLLVTIPIFAAAAYTFLLDIRMRVDDAVVFVSYPRVNPDMHMSIYSLASNAFVAFKSFMSSPFSFLFGSGLGSHPVSYDKFFSSGVSNGFMQNNYPEVCKGDAGSLFLRLFSETGLFGIAVVFYFIFKFRFKANNNKNLSMISNAIFILFILQLLRQGHYFYNGLFFFVWVYYFAYKLSNSKTLELKNY